MTGELGSPFVGSCSLGQKKFKSRVKSLGIILLEFERKIIGKAALCGAGGWRGGKRIERCTVSVSPGEKAGLSVKVCKQPRGKCLFRETVKKSRVSGQAC